MSQISRIGFGQVEPNHLTGIVDGSIYAQLPADTEALGTILEQGRFAKYDYAVGKVDLKGEGPWMMIYNEEKKYDERFQSHKDFAYGAEASDGILYPRLIEINVGDIYTTNTFGANTSRTAKVDGITLNLGDKVYVNASTGYLDITENANSPVFQVVKVCTMPDGQPGVKLQRIA